MTPTWIHEMTQQQITAPLLMRPPDIPITEAKITYQIPAGQSLLSWLEANKSTVWLVAGGLFLLALLRREVRR